MFRIGEIQKLRAVKKVDFGMYLTDGTDDGRILLPIRQVPENLRVNDEIEVFVYRDSDDRPIATVNRPKLTLNDLGLLEVVSVTKIGAFLNWGLERDLFLPYAQQTRQLHVGENVLVSLYLDKVKKLTPRSIVLENGTNIRYQPEYENKLVIVSDLHFNPSE